jgi:ELWxxDGT repeat protein
MGVALSVFAQPAAAAGPPFLVKDINPGGSSSPLWLTPVGDALFFSATNGKGRELFKSDGTAIGTMRVKDIRPGSRNSNPKELTDVAGTLFFAANDGAHGVELWKSDGTPDGTVMVENIHPSGDSNPHDLVNVNGLLFFAAKDPGHGIELWRSDGTADGTYIVEDIRPGPKSSNPAELIKEGSRVAFAATTVGPGRELWASDGTEANTYLVADLNPGEASSNPSEFTASGGRVYFSATYGANLPHLHWMQGNDHNPVSGETIMPLLPRQLRDVGGVLYLTTNFDSEVWRTDSTQEGTVQLEVYNCGLNCNEYTVNGGYTGMNGKVYYVAKDPVAGYEVLETDGTPGNAAAVKDINDNNGAFATPHSLTRYKGKIYFGVNTPGGAYGYGVELWRTDGTAAGTKLVADINPGNQGSFPSELMVFDGKLFFSAQDSHGRELWALER